MLINSENRWSTEDGSLFFPRYEETYHSQLPPGLYNIVSTQTGIAFEKRNISSNEGLIRFSDTIIDEAILEIKNFWSRKDIFDKYNFPFKRGMMFYGPPGAGKSCAIKMLIDDLIKLNGVSFTFNNPGMFYYGLEIFRKVQPDTPVIAIMEDIDRILEQYEEDVADLMDGHSCVENIVFIATTNNINKISDRIKNRPSRFDKKIYVPPPNRSVRFEYFSNIIGSDNEFNVDIGEWADKTEGLTFAHMKELFMSVCFFGSDFVESITRLMSIANFVDEYEEDDFYDDDMDEPEDIIYKLKKAKEKSRLRRRV